MKVLKNIYFQVVVVLILSVGLIVGFTSLTKPLNDKFTESRILSNYKQLGSDKYNDVEKYEKLEDDEYDKELAEDVVILYNNNKEVLGYVFTGNQKNDYGTFKIQVATDNDGVIIGAKFLEYKQTDSYKSIADNNLEKHIGKKLGESVADLEIGATSSTGNITKALNEFNQIYKEIGENDPLYDAFGSYEIKDSDEELTGNIKRLENIVVDNKVVGHKYTITDEGEYESWDGIHEGKITISLTYKIDGGNIVLVEALDEGYGHTISYKKHVDEYLENFNNTNVYNLDETLANTELSASASGSTELAKKMLLELSEAIQDPLYLEFGNYEIVRQEDLEDEFYEVVEHIVVNDEVVGYKYQLVDKGDFRKGGDTGALVEDKKITLIIIYNLETGNIVDLYAPSGDEYYEHTDDYKHHVDDYLNLLVNNNINNLLDILSNDDMAPSYDLEAGGTGGAKFTKDLVVKILKKLYNEKVEGGN